MSCVVLRTHGGFGNQLFQILYGRLFSEKYGYKMCEVHDMNYKHKFSRAEIPLVAELPSRWQSVFSAARIPKFLQRVFGRSEKPWHFFGTWFIDGYYQDKDQYCIFDDENIQLQLLKLASEIGIEPVKNNACIVHLRLGDFFCDQDSAKQHVINRLLSAPLKSHVITNQEELLNDPQIKKLMAERHAYLISTIGFSPLDLLRTIAGYRQIDANGSTLTFWAHVLAGSQVNFTNQHLSLLAKKFERLGPHRQL